MLFGALLFFYFLSNPSTEPYYAGDAGLQNTHSISRVKKENSVGMASDYFSSISYMFLTNARGNSILSSFLFSFFFFGTLECCLAGIIHIDVIDYS